MRITKNKPTTVSIEYKYWPSSDFCLARFIRSISSDLSITNYPSSRHVRLLFRHRHHLTGFPAFDKRLNYELDSQGVRSFGVHLRRRDLV